MHTHLHLPSLAVHLSQSTTTRINYTTMARSIKSHLTLYLCQTHFDDYWQGVCYIPNAVDGNSHFVKSTLNLNGRFEDSGHL